MKTPIFTSQADGSVTVDSFTDEVLVSPEFLRLADPRFVQRKSFRTFAIVCANAAATYRIMHRDTQRRTMLCRLA